MKTKSHLAKTADKKNSAMTAKPLFLMPRGSLNGLLVTMLACLLPHAGRLPLWMLGFAGFCIFYRILIYLQKARFPNSFMKAIFAIAGTWLLLREYGTLMAPDGGVAFLLLGYFLKALEMHYRRDAMVLMLLSFFVIPTQFLYQSDLSAALWVLVCYLLIIGTLVSFYQQNDAAFHVGAYWTGAKLISLAIPITIALFLFFPRLPPFWHLPSSKPTQTIGLSDQLDMDSLGELFKSGKVAFRAEFLSGSLARHQLYWRGVVMEQFDGNSWLVRTGSKLAGPHENATGDIHYKVYLEPTQQNYLFVLAPVSGYEGEAVLYNDNGMLLTRKPVISQIVYQATVGNSPSALSVVPQPDSLRKNTLLPVNAAPRTREQARLLFKNAKHDADRMTEEIRHWIFANDFSYTLSPPATTGDRVDDFLFRTRAGYCSHYASAVAVMLRSVGIPARVIGGYQGGEYQAAANYWIVHQYDAHAWVEYYSAATGWTLFDPTAAISPMRIENGMEQMGSTEQGDMFGAYAINQWPVFRELRRGLDYLNYQWIVNVVGYQQAAQNEMFKNWFGGSAMENWLPWLLGAVTTVCGLLLAYVYWRERPPPLHPVDALMLACLNRIRRRFRPRGEAETIAAYCQAYAATGASNGAALLSLCEQYHRLRYRSTNPASKTLRLKTPKGENGRLPSAFTAFKSAAKRFK